MYSSETNTCSQNFGKICKVPTEAVNSGRAMRQITRDLCDLELEKFFDFLFKKTSIFTYLIRNCNTSVGIIDLVSHTTYVVCVNFIHK